MKGLLIDTSRELCLIALIEGPEVVQWLSSPHGNQLSKYMLPAIKTLLDNQKIEYIAAGCGPGSFTGVRIGAAVAKSLAFGLKIPLIGFDSALAYAEDAREKLPAFLYGKYQTKEYSLESVLHLSY